MYAPPPLRFPPPPPPAPIPPTPPRRSHAALIVVIVVVIVVIAAIGLAVYLTGSGTVAVTVTSTHLTTTVSVTVYVDGSTIANQLLGPGQSATFDHTVFVGGGCRNVLVSATSTGGGLGPQSDFSNPSVCAGQTATTSLLV